MDLQLRAATSDDATALGRIMFEAFNTVASAHGFPPDFPSAEVATGLLGSLLQHPLFHGVVAELDGRIVGSNFLDERTSVRGLGPITVDPGVQNRSVGRRMMEYMLDRADADRCPVRLVQAAYHNRSLSLYARLGFDVRAPLSNLQGPPLNAAVAGDDVQQATAAHLDACDDLCARVHGHDRRGEVEDAVRQGQATVVTRGDRMVGYATSVGFVGHAVAEDNEALKALIGAAPSFFGPGFLLPSNNGDVLRWCLERGLRIVQPMTLMTRGPYQEPAGAYLPSILY